MLVSISLGPFDIVPTSRLTLAERQSYQPAFEFVLDESTSETDHGTCSHFLDSSAFRVAISRPFLILAISNRALYASS